MEQGRGPGAGGCLKIQLYISHIPHTNLLGTEGEEGRDGRR